MVEPQNQTWSSVTAWPGHNHGPRWLCRPPTLACFSMPLLLQFHLSPQHMNCPTYLSLPFLYHVSTLEWCPPTRHLQVPGRPVCVFNILLYLFMNLEVGGWHTCNSMCMVSEDNLENSEIDLLLVYTWRWNSGYHFCQQLLLPLEPFWGPALISYHIILVLFQVM